MKGLLLKDWFLFTKRCRSVMLFAALAIILPAVVPDAELATLYIALFLSLIPFTLLAYDERDKWDRYAAALPYTARSIVVEKYLFGFALSAVVVTLALGTSALGDSLRGEFDAANIAGLAVILVTISLLAPATMLPFVFRLGTEKGRLMYYVVVGVAFAAIFVYLSLTGGFTQVSFAGEGIGVVAPFVAAALYVGSIALSVRFYARRKL